MGWILVLFLGGGGFLGLGLAAPPTSKLRCGGRALNRKRQVFPVRQDSNLPLLEHVIARYNDSHFYV